MGVISETNATREMIDYARKQKCLVPTNKPNW